MENRFINSLEMWKLNIRMHQNDRSAFKSQKLVGFLSQFLVSYLLQAFIYFKIDHSYRQVYQKLGGFKTRDKG